MPLVGFEPTTPASERPQTHVLDRAATGNNTKILLPKSSQICLYILQLEPGIQDYRLPWMFSKHKPGLMLGKTRRMTHLTIFMCFQSDVQVLWSSPHLFRLLALFSIIRGLAVAVVPWMWDLWRSYQNYFVKWSSRWILSFAAASAAGVLWYLDTILFNVWRSPSLSFGFQPLFLSADDVFPWFTYAVITLEAAVLYTPNKVAI